jgi:hypothetical protein
LPILEGTNVNTRYGLIRTDHVLFIAAGAFHVSKPSDLIPEIQGRFPIRVEMKSLTQEDFVRILREPKNALIRQYTALMETEGVKLRFTDEAVREIARLAGLVNESAENIGARRLHTIMEALLEDISFSGMELKNKSVKIDAAFVRKKLGGVPLSGIRKCASRTRRLEEPQTENDLFFMSLRSRADCARVGVCEDRRTAPARGSDSKTIDRPDGQTARGTGLAGYFGAQSKHEWVGSGFPCRI